MNPNHPANCRGCHGAGYRPGPPMYQTVNGRQHHYTTVKPCEHDHWHDDPFDADPTLAAHAPKAIAAHEDGYAKGRHDLWVLSGGQLGEQHPNARQQGAA